MINIKVTGFLFLIFLSILACNKPKKTEYIRIAGLAQGTTYHIAYENSPGKNLQGSVDSILNEIDNTLSIYNPKSTITRINANDENVTVNDLFKKVFYKSVEVNNNSGGTFDPTVGPLALIWGFGPKKHSNVSKKQVEELLRYVGMDKVCISGNKVIKKFPQVCLDFNAIAQGFSVDVVCKFFDSLNIKNYLVEIGGEVRAKGKNPKGETWRIGIDKPVDKAMPGENIQAVLALDNKSVATSGDYRKFFIEDGKKYAHHIDPSTGYPAKQNLLSASIIADDCITADAYGTACMVMGLEKSKKFLSDHTELDAYLIYSDNNGKLCEYVTEGAEKILQH
jgi:FAD:protein FMN transferase